MDSSLIGNFPLNWIAMTWHAHGFTTIPMQRRVVQLSDGKAVPGHQAEKSAAMHTWPSIVLVAPAYLLAGSRGYWPVRWRTGIEVSTTGRAGAPIETSLLYCRLSNRRRCEEAVAL